MKDIMIGIAESITIKQLIEYWEKAENQHTDFDVFYKNKRGIRTKNCRFWEMNPDDEYVLADYKYKKLIGFNSRDELEEHMSVYDLLFTIDKFSNDEIFKMAEELKIRD